MATRYYITAEVGGILTNISLDATLEYREDYRGSLSRFKLGNNEPASDHMALRNPVFTLSGAISDIKSPTSIFYKTETVDGVQVQDRSEKQFEITNSDGAKLYRLAQTNKEQLIRIRNERLAVTVHAGEDIFRDCVITNINFNQNSENGNSGGTKAFAVSITLEKVRRASRATTARVRNTDLKFDEPKEVSGPKAAPTPEQEESWLKRFVEASSQGSFGAGF